MPRLLGQAFPSPRLVRLHLGGFVLGALLQAAPLILGGVLLGTAMNDPNRPFMDAFKPGLMAFRLATLGDLLVLLSAVLWAVNFAWALVRACRACCGPVLINALRPQPLEAGR